MTFDVWTGTDVMLKICIREYEMYGICISRPIVNMWCIVILRSLFVLVKTFGFHHKNTKKKWFYFDKVNLIKRTVIYTNLAFVPNELFYLNRLVLVICVVNLFLANLSINWLFPTMPSLWRSNVFSFKNNMVVFKDSYFVY